MTHSSAPELLALHAVRLLGFADSKALAARYHSNHGETLRWLNGAEGVGLVQHMAFADMDGWSLTDAGKIENERQLVEERMHADPECEIEEVYEDFLPLNSRLVRAVTDWQIKPTHADRFAPNDHSDSNRDARVLNELVALGIGLTATTARLANVLSRFEGYSDRYHAALRHALDGEHVWVDKTNVDSCHGVWFQLHEDFIATLGIDRRAESIDNNA